MPTNGGEINFQWRADSGRVTAAEFIASPNCDARPPDARVEVLVIHAISLPPNEYGGGYIEKLFTNRLRADAHPYFAAIARLKVSAHFLIRRDGGLAQFVSTHRRAWHAGESEYQGRARVNDFSIGVELEGGDRRPFAAIQYVVLAKLAKLLMAHYPQITADRIVGHSDIAPRRKTDPGPYFDWARLRRAVA